MKQVLILGNGVSRKKVRKQIENWKFDLWACNWGFKEAVVYNINRVYSVHPEVVKEAAKFRQHYKLDYSIISRKGDVGSPSDGYFKKELGWSTGNLAIVDAMEEKYDKILLAGFDFGGSDIYQSHQLPGGNFFKQFMEILRKYGEEKIFFLREGQILSVSQMRASKVNSFWASMDKKALTPDKKIPYFKPSIPERTGRTLIIGNSPKVLEYDFGEIIDSFDTIIRINDYTLEGYENQLGTRTDIWFTGAAKVARKRSEFDIVGTTPILGLSASRLHMNENDRIRGKLFQDLKATFDIPINRFRIIPFDLTTQIQRKHNLSSPTTGFMAIFYFLEYLKFSNVTLHGFDFYDNPYHYYDEDKIMKTTLSVAHENGKEKEIVERWIKNKRVRVLSEDDSFKPANRKVKNVVIFGTSPFLDKLDFNKIEELRNKKDIVFAGVNRIFYKFQPDYFFFMDGDIIEELKENGIQRDSNSRWLTSEFLYGNSQCRISREKYASYSAKQKIEELDINFEKSTNRKSSLLWLMCYLQNFEFKDYLCKFYLVGVELKTSNVHYFGHKTNKNRPGNTLSTQYISQYKGIGEFLQKGFHIMSLNPNSKVNELVPFINIPVEKFIEENFADK